MERTTRRAQWASNQALNASSSSLQDLVNPTAPVVRWARTWSNARSFPAPPSHAIGNTPGIKIASVKAQFYKWNPMPEKQPVDFSEDDLYIGAVPDSDLPEDEEAMDVDEKEGDEKANEDEDNAKDQEDTAALKKALSAGFGGIDSSSSSSRSGGLKLNTLATRFLNDNANNHSNTPPNSAI